MRLIKLTSTHGRNDEEPILINPEKIYMVSRKTWEVGNDTYTAVYLGQPEKTLPIRVKESLNEIAMMQSKSGKASYDRMKMKSVFKKSDKTDGNVDIPWYDGDL